MRYEIAIIGGGPAGLAAACAAKEAGCGSILILERDRENDADRYEDENEFAVWRLENSKKGESY